jgi:lycopene cyclase domain-containing protein
VTYTQLAVLAVILTVVVDLWVLRTRLLRRRVFWVSYAIIVSFQLITNGILTGYEIVTYDGDVIIGSSTPQFIGDGRLVYAPIEDLMFGFALVVLTLCFWVFWGRRGVQRDIRSGPPLWVNRANRPRADRARTEGADSGRD